MSAPEVIKLAILAVGGQGGGVLTGWLVALAEANGWRVQSTVVAGVAQRTGATIYYLEMAPAGERAPVFALAPAAGDVDILIAAELMEAGRAVMRGFVTPDRTTLIASTHRTHAVSEKIVPGDGQAPEAEVFAAMETAAKRLIAADYQQAAVDAGSVISASLFGAIAGSGALPFPRESFTDVIEASGRGVNASLRAFEAGAAGDTPLPDVSARSEAGPQGPARLLAQWTALEARLAELPAPVREMVEAGLRHVVDFQDPAYGTEYLDRLDRVVAADGGDYAFSIAAAKYIANGSRRHGRLMTIRGRSGRWIREADMEDAAPARRRRCRFDRIVRRGRRGGCGRRCLGPVCAAIGARPAEFMARSMSGLQLRSAKAPPSPRAAGLPAPLAPASWRRFGKRRTGLPRRGRRLRLREPEGRAGSNRKPRRRGGTRAASRARWIGPPPQQYLARLAQPPAAVAG